MGKLSYIIIASFPDEISQHAAVHVALTNLLRVGIFDKCDGIQAIPSGDMNVDKPIQCVRCTQFGGM